MCNGRCRMHRGASTGPRTPQGLARSRRARWKHRFVRGMDDSTKRRDFPLRKQTCGTFAPVGTNVPQNDAHRMLKGHPPTFRNGKCSRCGFNERRKGGRYCLDLPQELHPCSRRSSEAPKPMTILDTTQNAHKCVTPGLREQGDACYEWNQTRRCACLPRLRKAVSTEAALAETMQPSMPTTSLCPTATNRNPKLLRGLTLHPGSAQKAIKDRLKTRREEEMST